MKQKKTKPAAKLPTPPSARAHALLLLAEIIGKKQTLDEAAAAHPFTGSEEDGRFVKLLVLTTLRHMGQVDAVLERYLEKKLTAKRAGISHALRMGAVQLLLLETPAHAAVNETVAAVKKGRDAPLAGLVNAVLQKIAKEKPALPAAVANVPAWLAARWTEFYGADIVAAMATVATTRPPLDVNSTVEMPDATRLDAQMLRLPAEHGAVEALPGYQDGAFFVQDVAASYPARLLGDMREHQVLDVCAAPGGKTMQMIRAGGFVTALDRSPARMRVLKDNLARMNMQTNRVVADVLEWQPSRAYDAVLLDAPCSATGTWRRHPEVVQIVSEADIAELVQLQRQFLLRAWQWVKPGGRMVYCVCSLEREEGEAQAAWFAAQQADAVLLPVDVAVTGIAPACATPEGWLRTRPDLLEGGMDGFFAACWQKQ